MPITEGFAKAVPVWIESLRGQMNTFISFHAAFEAKSSEPFNIRVAASSSYRIWVNECFVGQGPARSPEGYARIDSWTGATSDSGSTEVVVEVSSYGVPSFCEAPGPAFLSAELLVDKEIVAWTSDDLTGGFFAEARAEKANRIERYSYQRAFCEGYSITSAGMSWLRRGYVIKKAQATARIPESILWLDRAVSFPGFFKCLPLAAARGRAWFDETLSAHAVKRRFIHEIPETVSGYLLESVDWPLFSTVAGLRFTETSQSRERIIPNPIKLSDGTWTRFDFGVVLTGFISLHIHAHKDTRVVLLFDEVLIDEEIVFDRLDSLNALWINLKAEADIDFQSFEPYTYRFLQVLVWTGEASVSSIRTISYTDETPFSGPPAGISPDETMVREAAIRSYRQNSLDIFMDCPSRERAGWLCDSYFTARAEWHFTGRNQVELAFLENYLLPLNFSSLPSGMVPMCYPASVLNGQYIPNWAMFLILQLDEAMTLRHIPANWLPLVQRRVVDLLEYFRQFENELGLLEKLEGWVFVEWSRANDFVKEINFPTNMLYAATLRASARILHRADLTEKARQIENSIRNLSTADGVFLDCAIRMADGSISVVPEASEVCQYYALYFGLTSPQESKELWARLVAEDYGRLHSANTFIGKLLRLELLVKHGEVAAAQRELLDHFLPMAENTGTLWEHADTRASCNHGFTSYVGVLIDRLIRKK